MMESRGPRRIPSGAPIASLICAALVLACERPIESRSAVIASSETERRSPAAAAFAQLPSGRVDKRLPASPMFRRVARSARRSAPDRGPELATVRETRGRRLRVEIESISEVAALDDWRSWIVAISETASGAPIAGEARLDVSGGMPRHGHGLPTRPRAIALGEGRFRIEGLKLPMAGWWEVHLAIVHDGEVEVVTFDVPVDAAGRRSWNEDEAARIAALALSRLGPPPEDPTNRVADDDRAAALGEVLFFDRRLSADGSVACASCHRPERRFADARATSRGLGETSRNAPSLVGAAYSRWLFWDGRADSLWAQALGPIEDPREHGLTRADVRRVVARHHAPAYEQIFGPLERSGETEAEAADRVAVGVAKALAAYVRRLEPEATRFDAYAGALARGDSARARELLDAREELGLALFLGKAQCERCHSGPLFSDREFHNTGLASAPGGPVDRGRASGAAQALESELNCRGRWSDDPEASCRHLDFARVDAPELVGAFKTPSLRGLGASAPYMHDGRFATLAEVLDHYDRAPAVSRRDGHGELFPLGLSAAERSALEAFLRTLDDTPDGDTEVARSGSRFPEAP